MTNTIKNTATPMRERLKGFGQIVIAGVLIALVVGEAFAVANGQGQNSNEKLVNETKDNVTYKYFGGLMLKEIVTDDTYTLTDGNVTMLYINETAIEESLDENLPNRITKEEALKISDKLCGEGYIFERITENPFDFDILYKKYVGGVEVFGGNCYVTINSKTGKIGTYRKLIFDIPKLSKPKISKEEIKKKIGVDADLVVIPHANKIVWATKESLIRMFDADTGKEISETEGKKMIDEIMKTDKGVGNLKKKSIPDEYFTKSINNNQGAVFRDYQNIRNDDILKVKASMETK